MEEKKEEILVSSSHSYICILLVAQFFVSFPNTAISALILCRDSQAEQRWPRLFFAFIHFTGTPTASCRRR